jgi:hypothetical protein
MSIKAKLAQLERQASAPDAGNLVIVLAGDADRARLAALSAGQRAYILADPVDHARVEATRARGVRVTARYIGAGVLEAV